MNYTKDSKSNGPEATADQVFYKPPVPIVPYPHKSKDVTPWGFERDQLTYPQKVVNSINEHLETNQIFEVPLEKNSKQFQKKFVGSDAYMTIGVKKTD